MNEELQSAVEAGKINSQAAEALEKLTPGSYCQHKSWGFGRVAEWNLLTGQILIDFGPKKGHPMQIQYAAETLTPIPPEHILARKASDPASVKAQASEDPVGLVRSILADHGGKASVEQIASSLSPQVFDAAGFKKWWDATKKKLKTDGHFQLPAKKTEPVVLLATPSSPGEGLLEKFKAARHLKDQVSILDQISKVLNDLSLSEEDVKSLVGQIEDAANKAQRLQPAPAVELLLGRDEILARGQAAPAADAVTPVDILRNEQSRLPELLALLPAAKQRRLIELLPTAFEDRWIDVTLRLTQQAPARLVVEISRMMEKEGHQDDLRTALARWVSERSTSTEILIWLCKERGGPYAEIFTPDLLGNVFSALERDQLDEKRGSRLKDLLFEDRELIGDLLTEASPDQARDLMRRLIMTPVFDDLSKRSLLGRFVKLNPDLQSMIAGDSSEKQETLTVSWPSLEKRKEEFEDLINRQIPENLRDIAIAKEEGDLRENFGFKAAKEQQRVLQRRRSETERDLGLARGTNFENPDTSLVSIGTTVTVTTEDGKNETYSILGAWDSAPELGIVSYKAAIGQAILGKKVGETLDFPSEFGTRQVTVTAIKPFTDLEVLREKVHVLNTPATA